MRATVSRDMLLDNVFVPEDAEVLPPGLFGAMYNAFPHLFLSFSATFLGVMQAAYDGALAYLTGRMPGAPIPHTEIAAKGHAIAEMLFAIESARAIYYRAISEAQVDAPLEAVQRARAAHGHRPTRGGGGHPGGDPRLWRTGLPQALSVRALRT
ncbi:MAG TPA: hypothetical protein VJ251_03340 [Stellaceae bacterium]|nr:hypothetical protein [Stellaceae bacterium]